MAGFNVFKNLILDPIFTLLYFPFWWYSRGLIRFLSFLKKTIEEIACPFVLKILVQNVIKPMYGDYSREGRIISFIMRIIHLSWRLFRVVFVSLISLIVLAIYLIILPFIFYKIICLVNDSCHYFLISPIL